MSEPAPLSQKILGLELSTRVGLRYATFPPGQERVFTLGSSANADIRLEVWGVDPVVFHVERYCDELWLVPVRRGQRILVNAERVDASARLGARAVIEFGDERIYASAFDATDFAESGPPVSGAQELERLMSLPGDDDPTFVALPAVRRTEDGELLATQLMRPQHTPPAFAHEPVRVTPLPPGTAPAPVSPRPAAAPLDAAPLPAPAPPAYVGAGMTELLPVVPRPKKASFGVQLTERIPLAHLTLRPFAGVEEPAVPAPVVAVRPSPPPPKPSTPPPLTRDAQATAMDLRAMAQAARGEGASPAGGPFKPSDERTVVSVQAPSTGTLGRAVKAIAGEVRGSRSAAVAVAGRPSRVATVLKKHAVVLTAGTLAVALLGAMTFVPTPPTGARRAAQSRSLAVPVTPGAPSSSTPTPAAPTPAAPTPAASTPVAPTPAASAASAPETPLPAVVIVTPGAPSNAANPPSAKKRPLKGPADPDVIAAVGALARGRDGDAKLAYERLAARSPENPAYAALAALLQRLASPECAGPATPSGVSCPEVKR